MAKPHKTKAHHSFLRNDALGCNVGYFQKTGKGLKEILHSLNKSKMSHKEILDDIRQGAESFMAEFSCCVANK